MAEHFVECSVKSAVCLENGQWPAVIFSSVRGVQSIYLLERIIVFIIVVKRGILNPLKRYPPLEEYPLLERYPPLD